MIRTRPFVEECGRLLVDEALPFVDRDDDWDGEETTVTLPISIDGGSARMLTANLVSTEQHLGGRRWWWQCPACERRCRYLLGADEGIACRRCLAAVYRSDYPSAARRAQLADLFSSFLWEGDLLGTEARSQLDLLFARRRRGVCRGRRVRARALRLLARARGQIESSPAVMEQFRPATPPACSDTA